MSNGFYRDLGRTRTLEAAYQVYEHQDSIKTVPGFFREWCQKSEWVDRVLKFDLESDRIRLEGIQGEAHRAHELRLEQVRSAAEKLALTRLSTSLRTAEIVRDTIDLLYKDCALETDGQTRQVVTPVQAEFLWAIGWGACGKYLQGMGRSLRGRIRGTVDWWGEGNEAIV